MTLYSGYTNRGKVDNYHSLPPIQKKTINTKSAFPNNRTYQIRPNTDQTSRRAFSALSTIKPSLALPSGKQLQQRGIKYHTTNYLYDGKRIKLGLHEIHFSKQQSKPAKGDVGRTTLSAQTNSLEQLARPIVTINQLLISVESKPELHEFHKLCQILGGTLTGAVSVLDIYAALRILNQGLPSSAYKEQLKNVLQVCIPQLAEKALDSCKQIYSLPLANINIMLTESPTNKWLKHLSAIEHLTAIISHPDNALLYSSTRVCKWLDSRKVGFIDMRNPVLNLLQATIKNQSGKCELMQQAICLIPLHPDTPPSIIGVTHVKEQSDSEYKPIPLSEFLEFQGKIYQQARCSECESVLATVNFHMLQTQVNSELSDFWIHKKEQTQDCFCTSCASFDSKKKYANIEYAKALKKKENLKKLKPA